MCNPDTEPDGHGHGHSDSFAYCDSDGHSFAYCDGNGDSYQTLVTITGVLLTETDTDNYVV